MGLEIQVNSLEEMCDLMCDNVVPKRSELPEEKQGWWVFTFGCGQPHAGKYVKIKGTRASARAKMVEKYGERWGFQYTLEDWEDWEKSRPSYFPIETLMEVIE